MDNTKFMHPEFLHAQPDYVKIRDCYNGERSIKEAGTRYLPKLKGQSTDDYNNYKFRALFFPITGKTASTMVGLATARPPKMSYPTELTPYFIDTNLNFQFSEFYVKSFLEVVLMGRYGVLIDAPQNGGEPKFVPYAAEHIVFWTVDAYDVPNSVLLMENSYVQGDSQFHLKCVTRYRHCYLSSGVYTVTIYDEDLVGQETITPVFTGSAIDFIPFVFFGATGVHSAIDRPPMLDVATINISHYLTSADLEWGRHIVGLPTPVVSGVDGSSKMSIGGTSAWILPPAEAKAYYLEFQGQGLQSLERAMGEKIGLMASMSARLIDTSTRGSEAAETVRLRYMSESASLVHILGSVEAALNLLYNMLARLKRLRTPVEIKLSREIVGLSISYKDLKVLFEAYFEGGISKETLVYNMRRLEAMDPDRSDQDELAAIRPPKPQTTTPPAAN